MAARWSDPWVSLSRQFSYLGEHLRLDAHLLRRLVEVRLLTRNDYDELTDQTTSQSRRIDRLLTDILPKRDPELFDAFCRILKAVGQGFLAQRLEESPDDDLSPRDHEAAIDIAGYETERTVDKRAPSPSKEVPELSRAQCQALVDDESDDDPWPAIRQNYVYLSQRLYFGNLFLSCLFEQRLISRDDYEMFSKDNVSNAEKTRRFLVDILPSKPPAMFVTFCDILRSVDQAHIADRLMGNPLEVQLFPRVQETSKLREAETLESLMARLASLYVEKKDAEEQLVRERKRADLAKEETWKATKDVQEVQRRAEREKVEKRGEQLMNLALRCKLSQCVAQSEGCDALPMWRLWNLKIPGDGSKWPYNRIAEIEDTLIAAGWSDCGVRVVTKGDDKWKKYVREDGAIWRVIAHKDICLVLVYDMYKSHFAVERFCLNKPHEWCNVTVLPKELQTSFVSFALQDNSLYAMGGGAGEGMTTARVCDLHSGRWLELDDMKTKRFSCSCVIANNTMFVGGGETRNGRYCNSVECLHIGSRGWKTLTATTNYHCTLQAVSNRLVATGGRTGQYRNSCQSDEVQLFDERCSGWLPLPRMAHKRWWHGTLVTQNGEILAAGGSGDSSVESLKF